MNSLESEIYKIVDNQADYYFENIKGFKFYNVIVDSYNGYVEIEVNGVFLIDFAEVYRTSDKYIDSRKKLDTIRKTSSEQLTLMAIEEQWDIIENEDRGYIENLVNDDSKDEVFQALSDFGSDIKNSYIYVEDEYEDEFVDDYVGNIMEVVVNSGIEVVFDNFHVGVLFGYCGM